MGKKLDIVKWLRVEAKIVALVRLDEAADEIERLRDEIEELNAEVVGQRTEIGKLRAGAGWAI